MLESMLLNMLEIMLKHGMKLLKKGEYKYMKKIRDNMLRVVSGALVMSILLSNVAFAGEWKQEGSTWKYQNDDGSLAKNTWQWINGRSYCFDGNGVMYSNTTTPDGYTVNADGAWTVNGVVQEQNTTTSVATNEQYPLAHLQKYFEMSSWTDKMDLKWNQMNVFMKYNVDKPSDYVMENAIKDKDIFYLISTMQGSCLLAIEKLAGISTDGWNGHENDPEVIAIENELRNFLNSFDWKNASDYEKAVAIAKKVNEAAYDNNGDNVHLPYGCLVEKRAACDSFTNTVEVLGLCVGLPVSGVELGFSAHAFPVYCINGVWFKQEPTNHDTNFELYDYHDALQAVGDYTIYVPFVKYCMGTGYEVPTIEEAKTKFSGIPQFVDSRGKLNLPFGW